MKEKEYLFRTWHEIIWIIPALSVTKWCRIRCHSLSKVGNWWNLLTCMLTQSTLIVHLSLRVLVLSLPGTQKVRGDAAEISIINRRYTQPGRVRTGPASTIDRDGLREAPRRCCPALTITLRQLTTSHIVPPTCLDEKTSYVGSLSAINSPMHLSSVCG